MNEEVQNLISKELNEAKFERSLSEEDLKTKANEFANKMKEEIGEDIRKTLSSFPEEAKKEKEPGVLKKLFAKIVRTCS
jgi:hypothetical protein